MNAQGSCLCGQVRYSVEVPAIVMNNCHCSRCRKASGAAFGTYLHVALPSFAWRAGHDAIVDYRPDNGDARPFCGRCGSRVPVIEEEGVIIPAGTLDGDPLMRPAVNIFAASKASWYALTDDLPTFDGNAPDSFWEQFE